MLIDVKIDKEADINSFYENIFGEQYVRKWGFIKKRIFHWYPPLEVRLENITDTEMRKKIIHEYVDVIYLEHSTKIQNIAQNIRDLFATNTQKIVDGLSATMDFDPQDIAHVNLILSLKPNSTFSGTKVVTLSIVSEVFKNQAKPYVDIFIHELTHIIRNQKVGKVYDTVGKLGPLAHEDLKEIVTPVIMRDAAFQDVVQSERMKEANEKQQLLQISVNGIHHNIVDYFGLIYQNMKKQGAPFEEIMAAFVKIFLNIENQIVAKHAIYNEFGSSSNNKDVALKIFKDKGYLDPIILP